MNLETAELLDLLQHCATKLLLAFDKTMHPDYWAAYEKTAEACETLYFQCSLAPTLTIH